MLCSRIMRRYFIFTLCWLLAHGFVTADDPWDRNIKEYFNKNKISFLSQMHYYTYLYNAQNDVGIGDTNLLICVAEELAKKIFPDFENQTPCPDPIKQKARDVLKPYFERLALEEQNTHTFPSLCWCTKEPTYVAQIAHWIPWSPPLPKTPPPPPLNDHRFWGNNLNSSER